MLTAAQYRTNALEFDALAKASDSPDQTIEFQRLARSFSVLATNQQWMVDNHQNTVSSMQKPHQKGLGRC
jgi:hypothetical protein